MFVKVFVKLWLKQSVKGQWKNRFRISSSFLNCNYYRKD